MGHIKELLEDATNIGQVTAQTGNNQAHYGVCEMARQAGKPVSSAHITLGEVALATGIDAEAARLAPELAAWIMETEVDLILAQPDPSDHLRGRVSERTVMLAAMRAASLRGRAINVLMARSPTSEHATWEVDASLASHPEAIGSATAYTRHLFRPGILAGGSIEHHFATPPDE